MGYSQRFGEGNIAFFDGYVSPTEYSVLTLSGVEGDAWWGAIFGC